MDYLKAAATTIHGHNCIDTHVHLYIESYYSVNAMYNYQYSHVLVC